MASFQYRRCTLSITYCQKVFPAIYLLPIDLVWTTVLKYLLKYRSSYSFVEDSVLALQKGSLVLWQLHQNRRQKVAGTYLKSKEYTIQTLV